MTFGVSIPTYYRPDGSSSAMLTRALLSVVNQTYEDWHVYLIGDRYHKEEDPGWEDAEFWAAADILPPDKITAVNLEVALERDSGLVGRDLWRCAGANANNVALKMQREDGIDVACHLDDDDVWLSDHLEALAWGYTEYSEAVFIHTSTLRLTALGFSPYPATTDVVTQYNNVLLDQGAFFHSSASWRLDSIPFYYISHPKKAADAYMWIQIRTAKKEKNWKTLYIPRTTVMEATKGRGYL